MDQVRDGPKVSSLPRPATRLPTRLPALTRKTVVPPVSSTRDPPVAIHRVGPSPAATGTLRTLSRPTESTQTESKRTSRPLPTFAPKSSVAPSKSRLQTPSRRAPAVAAPAHEVEEHSDQLGSLNGFRAASRQGINDTEPEEYLEPLQAPPMSRQRKPSRPSLSDRTIESLQTLPTTPKERRRSSFFSIESPMGPPPRPGSAQSRTSSRANSSRPSTSDGRSANPPAPSLRKAPASAKPASRTSISGFGFAPSGGRRAVSGSVPQSQPPPVPHAGPVSPSKYPVPRSKTLSARPTKPRPGLGGVFAPVDDAPRPLPGRPAKKVLQSVKPDETSSKSTDAAKSSVALRQHIAAAKVAARKHAGTASHDASGGANADSNGAFESELDLNPFNAPRDEKHMLRNRINGARMTGKLNIAAMNLKAVPDEVMHMFDPSSMEDAKVNWAEVVDLTKFIAADNELEEIDPSVFPDIAPDAFNMDEDSQGNQFGGLEMLDLHGNSLSAVPLGLRRLERLTSLNLAHNKLDHEVFSVISELGTLKELKLGHNNLAGHLSASLSSLKSLEVLDLQSNRILELPESLGELKSLRVLNIAGNQLTTLPMEALYDLPLVDLDASSNALIGSLFPLGGNSEHASLRALNVANNSLAALTFAEAVFLPQLRTLDVTNNHLTALPPMQHWTELTTLNAGDNKISDLPDGFTGLEKLRNVNFSNNSLRAIPPEVAKMESLTTLILSANPLRDKKYLTMTAADIKRDLLARLEPEESTGEESGTLGSASVNDHASSETAGSIFERALRPNGLLDLSNMGLDMTINDELCGFLLGATSTSIRQISLQGNKITRIPTALSAAPSLRVVDLSNNPLDILILSAPLDMPNLTELRMRSIGLKTLAHVLEHLNAPNLQSLDISANRLSGPLPAFRQYIPSLTTLLASDNKFDSVCAESLRGLQTVNLASNSLSQLPAEIGMLWDEGLKNFEVGSNLFRVPGYLVLQKGTEATLRWLRDRVPVVSRVGGESDLD